MRDGAGPAASLLPLRTCSLLRARMAAISRRNSAAGIRGVAVPAGGEGDADIAGSGPRGGGASGRERRQREEVECGKSGRSGVKNCRQRRSRP
jgi:hypothetical protein